MLRIDVLRQDIRVECRVGAILAEKCCFKVRSLYVAAHTVN